MAKTTTMPSSTATSTSVNVRPSESSSLDTSLYGLTLSYSSSKSSSPQSSPSSSPPIPLMPCGDTKLLSPVTHGFTFLEHPMSSRANNDTTSALDALASLASTHFSDAGRSSSFDNKSMPPPPRRMRRIRSASNPEGMEKWDSYNFPKDNNGMKRLRFVLPSCILEEELATANDMCIEHEKEQQRHMEEMERMKSTQTFGNMPVRKIGRTDFSIQSQPEVHSMNNVYGTSPDTVIPSLEEAVQTGNKSVGVHGKKSKKGGRKKKKVIPTLPIDEQDCDENALVEVEEEVNETDLEPRELLRRARSRLFEDLSAENGMEKGAMAFPHSLDKYKEVRHYIACCWANSILHGNAIAHITIISIINRFTTSMDELEFIHLQKELLLFKNLTARELQELGRKRFVTIVGRV